MADERRLCRATGHHLLGTASYRRQMEAVGVDPQQVLWISDDPAHRTPMWWHEQLEKELQEEVWRHARWI